MNIECLLYGRDQFWVEWGGGILFGQLTITDVHSFGRSRVPKSKQLPQGHVTLPPLPIDLYLPIMISVSRTKDRTCILVLSLLSMACCTKSQFASQIWSLATVRSKSQGYCKLQFLYWSIIRGIFFTVRCVISHVSFKYQNTLPSVLS